jgi:drug/metabolite transporter (DMT)-like permease
METSDATPRLPGPAPTLADRLRAWIISCVLMAVGAVMLVLAVMAGAVVLAVAVVLAIVMAVVGGVAFLVMRRRLRKRFEEVRKRMDPNLQGGRENVRVIVHPPGERV